MEEQERLLATMAGRVRHQELLVLVAEVMIIAEETEDQQNPEVLAEVEGMIPITKAQPGVILAEAEAAEVKI